MLRGATAARSSAPGRRTERTAIAALAIAVCFSIGCSGPITTSDASSTSGGSAQSSGGDATGGAGGAAPVTIIELTARIANAYPCDGQACGDYRIGVVLHDGAARAIAGVDRVRFGVGALAVDTMDATLEPDGGAASDAGALLCSAAPWNIAAAGTSTPASLAFSYLGGGVVRVACDGDFVAVAGLGHGLPPAPHGGTATLRLSGRFDDGTSWEADASTLLVDGTK